jgi:hypothetical protein
MGLDYFIEKLRFDLVMMMNDVGCMNFDLDDFDIGKLSIVLLLLLLKNANIGLSHSHFSGTMLLNYAIYLWLT